jgi:D-lactate dehydrogenase (cytochrome)
MTHGTLAVALAELRKLLGERVADSLAVREHHARDFTHPTAPVPDAVVFPLDAVEVAAAVRICAAHRLPMIAYGAGTSIEGQIGAPHGGVCLDLSRMDQVIRVNERDLDITVQPGITREALNSYVRDLGLFFPIDPGANATLGGMVATRASGTNAVRYGTMRDNVLALEVVLGGAHRNAGAQVIGRIRPDTTVGGLRRHARNRDRSHLEAVWTSRGHVRRGVRV